jgi:hypothetical protein
MALVVWTQKSGYSFGTFQERSTLALNLPVNLSAGVSNFRVISGNLPGGLRISGLKIIGTPYEVSRDTVYEFCIRAEKLGQISDRTFFITIQGPDAPEFITPAGSLVVNQNQLQYFVLDSSYVDFQIEALDRDTAAGQRLSFFIADTDGQLPPGLSLSPDGKITGWVEPTQSIKPEDGAGTYDDGYYDSVAFDFGSRPTNGFDSYIYDTVFFDYSTPATRPKKLNRNYEFVVSITDGAVTPTTTVIFTDNPGAGTTAPNTVYLSKRKFAIFVVGDDYFRSDNVSLLDGTSLFTADATYLRAPIWLTKSNLGLYRANNYITLILDTYDTNQVIYSLEEINSDISAVTLGKLYTDNKAGSNSISITNTRTAPVIGQWLSFGGVFQITDPLTDEVISSPDYRKYQISHVASLGNDEYRLTVVQSLQLSLPNNITFFIGDLSQLPTGLNFDIATAEIYGISPYQPAITKDYKFTVSATRFSDKGEYAKSPRVFTVSIIGEVESVMTWITPLDLGSINANFVSTLKIEATTSITGATVLYSKVSGRLPPGLGLNQDGELIGKVNQFYKPGNPGITRFFDVPPRVPTKVFTTFDNGATTIDRKFVFTVKATDQFGYSAITRTFSITVSTPNQIVYGNLKTRPFLKLNQRASWKSFINNSSVFIPDSIYRPNDENFGVQQDLSMLIFAGIETTEAAAYVSAMGTNHKQKRFQFGSVKKATAVIPGTRDQVYEVVYVQMIDPLEPDGNVLPNTIKHLGLRSASITVDTNNDIWSAGYSLSDPMAATKRARMARVGNAANRPDPILSIDQSVYEISNPNLGTYYPSSVSLWRERIKSSYRIDRTNPSSPITIPLEKERNYLPLWMRSIQPGTRQELDFQLAVPLCYCKVGTADDIILNIKYSGFDFKLLDYTSDRYIIDAVGDEIGDKYLIFRNDRITI